MTTTGAVRAYERALRDGGDLRVRPLAGGVEWPLEVGRYLSPANATDAGVLQFCTGRVLDVGCGPGRMLTALAERGHESLGIDIAREAVLHSRLRGGRAVRRSVFDPLPDEGRWDTALLLDGNIGIGGDPYRLLQRMRSVLAPGGTLVVETDRDPATDESGDVVLMDSAGVRCSEPFAWSRIGTRRLQALAAQLGFSLGATWARGGRLFDVLHADRAPDELAAASA